MRRLFAIAAALSCLIALAAAASWIRSYQVLDRVSCSERLRCAWESYDRDFQFQRWPPGMRRNASRAALSAFGKIFLEQRSYRSEPLAGAATAASGWASDGDVIPSFSYFHAITADGTRAGHWSVRQITLRHWVLVALFALLPAAWLIGWARRADR